MEIPKDTEESSVLGTPRSAISRSNRHPQYYFEDGIILLVENTYFKIPRRKLVASSLVFRGLLTVSPDWNEGKSEERPVVLEKVSSTDFERFLTYLYPLTTDYTRLTEGWDFEYWISILKVAHAYMMKDVYAQTISMLNELPFPDPFTRIQYGSRYDHANWIRQGYRDLIQREEPLSIKEAHVLGFEKAILCAAAREKHVAQEKHVHRRQSFPFHYDIESTLDECFTGANKLPGRV